MGPWILIPWKHTYTPDLPGLCFFLIRPAGSYLAMTKRLPEMRAALFFN